MNTNRQDARGGNPHGECGVIEYRKFCRGDSLAELTTLLHQAYRPLAQAGWNFSAATQGEDMTRQRIDGGECWLALDEKRIVGTIAWYSEFQTHGCPWYDRPDVAKFGQFGVAPSMQGLGIGGRLLDLIERQAVDSGVCELALDTSEGAKDLIGWYQRRGYRFIETVAWEGKTYRSDILSKTLRR